VFQHRVGSSLLAVQIALHATRFAQHHPDLSVGETGGGDRLQGAPCFASVAPLECLATLLRQVRCVGHSHNGINHAGNPP
jgi:hypothetical protein